MFSKVGKEGEPGSQLQAGDIVVYNGEKFPLVCGSMYFYLEDPSEYGGNKIEATLCQITGWRAWLLGLPRTDLEVVGHVDPFPTNRGSDIERDRNFLPANKKDLLIPWLGRREKVNS